MPSLQDIKAHAVGAFFDVWGRIGNPILNFGSPPAEGVKRDLAYGSDPKQTLDIHPPGVKTKSGIPVLIYFHGGGWISADKSNYNGICARLAQNGFLVVNVNYRLAPRHRFPAQLQDVAQAVAWIRRNVAAHGGDHNRIVMVGDSAGAQLASWYASALHKPELFAQAGIDADISEMRVQGLLLFYGVFDFETVLDTRFPFIKTYARSFLGAEPERYRANARLASPIRHIVRDLPPVFLCAGEKDKLFPQTVAYANALKDEGVDCRTLLFSRDHLAHHGFLFFRWLKPSRLAFAAAGEFLQDLGLTDRE
jgi:acetyl esterase/lipase